MRRAIMRCATVAALCLTIGAANAAMILSGNDAPIGPGENFMAVIAVNDSPGSSDLTLIVQLTVDGKIVIDEGHPIRAIEPLENIPGDNDPIGWTAPDFDDGDWIEGEQGIGYGDADDNLVIGHGNQAVVYGRMVFEVRNANVNSITLGVDYDDACVIFINGVEVARTAATDIGEPPEWDDWSDQGSGQSHEASKLDPPLYEALEIPVETVGAILAVEPMGKLVSSWSAIKTRY